MAEFLVGDWGSDLWRQALVILIDSGAKGIVLLALAGALSMAMRRTSAAARHWVWTLALGGLLALPALSLAVPKWQLPILPRADGEMESAATRTEGEAIDGPAVDDVNVMATGNAGRLGENPIAGTAPAAGSMPVGSQAGTPAPPGTPAPRGWAPLAMIVVLIWLAGALALAAPLAVGLAVIGRLRRKSRAFEGGDWSELAGSLGRSIGLRGAPQVLCAGPGAMPMAVGLIRAAVLLPEEVENWPEEKRRAALLHELAHVKRRDCLTHALARLAASLHWFNPLAWIALRRMRIERERACDDLVLIAGQRPSDYADHLLNIARTTRAGALASAAGITMARKGQLEGRLLAVLDAGRKRGAVTRGVFWVGLGILVGLILALSSFELTSAESDVPEELTLSNDPGAKGKTDIPPDLRIISLARKNGSDSSFKIIQSWKPDGAPVTDPQLTQLIHTYPVAFMDKANAEKVENMVFWVWHPKYNQPDFFSLNLTDVSNEKGLTTHVASNASPATYQQYPGWKVVAALVDPGTFPDAVDVDWSWISNEDEQLGEFAPDWRGQVPGCPDVTIEGLHETWNSRSELTLSSVSTSLMTNYSAHARSKSDGISHGSEDSGYGRDAEKYSRSLIFNIPIEEIESYVLLKRPSHEIRYRDVALKPAPATSNLTFDEAASRGATVAQSKNSPWAVTLPNGATIELLAIGHQPKDGVWWKPDGTPTEEPEFSKSSSGSMPPDQDMRNFCFRATGLPDEEVGFKANGAAGSSSISFHGDDPFRELDMVVTIAPKSTRPASLAIGLAAGPWNLVTETGGSGSSSRWISDSDFIMLGSPFEANGKTFITGTFGHAPNIFLRLIAIDKDGRKHRNEISGGQTINNHATMIEARFNVPIDQLERIELQSSEYQWAEFSGFAMKAK